MGSQYGGRDRSEMKDAFLLSLSAAAAGENNKLVICQSESENHLMPAVSTFQYIICRWSWGGDWPSPDVISSSMSVSLNPLSPRLHLWTASNIGWGVFLFTSDEAGSRVRKLMAPLFEYCATNPPGCGFESGLCCCVCGICLPGQSPVGHYVSGVTYMPKLYNSTRLSWSGRGGGGGRSEVSLADFTQTCPRVQD